MTIQEALGEALSSLIIAYNAMTEPHGEWHNVRENKAIVDVSRTIKNVQQALKDEQLAARALLDEEGAA